MALAGMVLGIVAIVLAFVPCIGLLALVPGVLAIVLAAIGLSQAKKAGKPKGMAVAGIACGIAACIWAPIWFFVFASAATVTMGDQIEAGFDEVQEGLERMELEPVEPGPPQE